MGFFRKNIDKLVNEVDNNVIVLMLNKKILTIISQTDFEVIVKLKQDFPLENEEKLVTIYQIFPHDDEREKSVNEPIFIDDSLQKCFEEKDNTIELKPKGRFRTSLNINNKIFDFYSAVAIERHNIFVNMKSKTSDKVDKNKKEEKRETDTKTTEFKIGVSYESECYENENKMKETWFLNKVKHRDSNLPCEIEYHENGNRKSETWFINGKKEREQGELPFRIEYYENGNKRVEERGSYLGTGEHDLPNKVYYDENGNISHEQWFDENGQRHRDSPFGDFPALIEYYENGNKEREEWYHNGEYYRANDLPCSIQYYENGNKKGEKWCKNGHWYRDQKQNSDSTLIDQTNDLPCRISYFESGKIQSKFWTKQGTRLHITVSYYENGNKEKEEHGYRKIHSEYLCDDTSPECIALFGPVLDNVENGFDHVISYDENGNKVNEQWINSYMGQCVRSIDY